MEIDRGLTDAVGAFVRELEPILADLAEDADLDVETFHDDLAVEALNLTMALIDSDDRHSDDELLGLITAFGGRLDTQLGSSTPDDVRESGMLDGKRVWLDTPSVLFDTLVKHDERLGTSHAQRYYDRAMDIAHTVASLDKYPSEDEIRALEAFRDMLLVDLARIRMKPPGPRDSQEAATSVPPPALTVIETPPETPPRPLEELLAELDALVGLNEVKAEVKLVTDLIRVQNMRKERKLPVLETSRHLVFTGNPGTGKTTVARLVAQIYRTLGVVERGHLVEADRSQLVVGYIGQTATRVREVFDSADQGVLLIDEAYALARGGERDFGLEAIDTIVKLVEDRRESVVVIVAGYPDEMATFIDANPGLRSRFPRTIFFPDYSDDELVRIFTSHADKAGYDCRPETLERVLAWFQAQARTKGFGNGRLARNLFEEAVGRQAGRIVAIDHPSDEQLTTLLPEDVPHPVPA